MPASGPTPVRVVLVRPEIPPNTGNIGRTCVGLGLPLHLVGRLGFSLSERRLRRAGLDYWPKLDLHVEADEDLARSRVAAWRPAVFTTRGSAAPWEVDLATFGAFVFGSESVGLPSEWMPEDWPRFRLPKGPGIRSYNLANTVHSALMEWVRQTGWDPERSGSATRG